MMPVPPVVRIGAAVQHSLAGNGNVLCITGIQQGAEVVAGTRLPVGEHQRVVLRRVIGHKLHQSVLRCKVQLHTVFQVQRTGAVDARLQDQRSASLPAEIVDRLLQLSGLHLSRHRLHLHPVFADAGQLDLGQDGIAQLVFVHGENSLTLCY